MNKAAADAVDAVIKELADYALAELKRVREADPTQQSTVIGLFEAVNKDLVALVKARQSSMQNAEEK